MPGLPASADAIVDERKIADYLLSPGHVSGSAKARFFAGFGFRRDAPGQMRAALLNHAAANEILRLQTTAHGVKYVIEGPLSAPDGRAPLVRTVWIVDAGTRIPRFVTAFPGGKARS